MKKVKSILFKAKISGSGIVNFDSNDQKFMWNQLKNKEHASHDNVSFAKKNWYIKNDELFYKLKISSDSLRHEIFEEDLQFQSPNIINNEALFLAFIASPVSIVRGYMFASKEVTLKKTSSLTITDAEQTCLAVSALETFSRSGKKVEDENKSDISFFKKETVGEIDYTTQGSIDFKELQFLSLDQVFDRLALNPDSFALYKKILQTKLPTFNSEPKFYQIKDSCVQIPEYGVLFSKEDVLMLTKELLKKILSINIKKAKSFAKLTDLKIKLVYDCTIDTMENDLNWITINTKDNIDSLTFESEVFFVEENKELANALRKEIEDAEAVIKIKNKEEKEKKVAEANEKKKRKIEIKEPKSETTESANRIEE
jgi:hypothetical protein